MMNRLFTAVLFVMLVSPGIALADQNSPKLPGLFKQLQSATDPAVIAETEQMIWRIWSLPGDRKASVPFVALFSNVTETAPDFAEGWNKRATVAYYLGDYETSVHDIQKTLSLEPRHFGALSGLALIYQSSGLESQALDVLIQVKEIYPAMPGIDERMQELRDIIAARKT
jgi:tetratricopeptide (TPR) repeat protein